MLFVKAAVMFIPFFFASGHAAKLFSIDADEGDILCIKIRAEYSWMLELQNEDKTKTLRLRYSFQNPGFITFGQGGASFEEQPSGQVRLRMRFHAGNWELKMNSNNSVINMEVSSPSAAEIKLITVDEWYIVERPLEVESFLCKKKDCGKH